MTPIAPSRQGVTSMSKAASEFPSCRARRWTPRTARPASFSQDWCASGSCGRARAQSLVTGFDFGACVWTAVELETRAGPGAARFAARIQPVVVRWDVGRYDVYGRGDTVYRADTPQKAISMWRHLLKTLYGDVIDNRLYFSGLLE